MFGGPWDSTLIMMGVPSLKMGVHSFYISVEFWEVVDPSVEGIGTGLSCQTGVAKHGHFRISTICSDLAS